MRNIIYIISFFFLLSCERDNTSNNIILEFDNGIGFCYWGAELIAWDGENSDSGSVWENQALFDFENKELPVLQEFNLN